MPYLRADEVVTANALKSLLEKQFHHWQTDASSNSVKLLYTQRADKTMAVVLWVPSLNATNCY